MAQHCGYVIRVEKLRPHPNADRLQLLDVFGTTTTVGLDVVIGDMGIYFPTDLQLSIEYCVANHLCRKNPLDGTADSGYMDGDKRNVTAIKLRGERSDGIYVPLSSLETFGDISKLKVGDTIDTFNGHLICEKYIPKSNKRAVSRSENGKPGKKNDKRNIGDEIAVTLPEPKEVDIVATEMALDIVYEDDDVLVINKPKGLVVHPAAGHQEDTLVNGLLYAKGDSLSGINGIGSTQITGASGTQVNFFDFRQIPAHAGTGNRVSFPDPYPSVDALFQGEVFGFPSRGWFRGKAFRSGASGLYKRSCFSRGYEGTCQG